MENRFETDRFPVVLARWFERSPEKRKVRLIVIHTMEAPENVNTAENVANYFKNTDEKASAHLCIDNNSVVQCVYDNDIAYAAPGANRDGIQLELAGYSRQLTREWADEYSISLLDRAASVAAQYCLKYGIPRRHLTNEQLRAGLAGIIGHYQATEVYKLSTHTDPGPNFPWASFVENVSDHYDRRLAEINAQ